MKKSKIRLRILMFSALILLTLGSLNGWSQPGPPNDGQNGDQTPEGGGAPLTGGIGFLITLGIGYGLVKWKKHKETIE
jgi:hypothetical protein